MQVLPQLIPAGLLVTVPVPVPALSTFNDTLAVEPKFTNTGVVRIVRLPSPSWPELLYPQAQRLPSALSAKLWYAPPDTAV